MGKILMIVLSVLVPPVAVFLQRGVGADLVINVVLWILGAVPGIVHALYITLK